MINEKPYIDHTTRDGSIIRLFDSNAKEDDLIWQKEEKDREITVLDGVGWKIQFENKLPVELKKGQLYNIKAMECHRLIKGIEGLTLRIWER